ncbi:MAG: VIT1/CCC1 transporter family protein [Chryseolinea sp.]
MNHQHPETHLKNSDFLTDIVIGMSDGLTVPFALAAGISSAVSDNHIVTTAGVAEIIAGCIAMGLGGYLAGKTEWDHYRSEMAKEYEEVERIPDKEREEIKEIFAEYGFDEPAQTLLANEISKDKDKWVKFMMKFELGLEQPDPNRAGKSALTIGLSYCAGGLIPLLPYFFTDSPSSGLQVSALVATIALFTFGFFKSKVTGQPVWTGALKVTIIGLIAAGAAFFAARLFAG